MNFFTFFSAGASGRVTLTNVDAASGSVPVPLQRLAPFDCVLVDAPCTSVTQPAESDRIFKFGVNSPSCVFLKVSGHAHASHTSRIY